MGPTLPFNGKEFRALIEQAYEESLDLAAYFPSPLSFSYHPDTRRLVIQYGNKELFFNWDTETLYLTDIGVRFINILLVIMDRIEADLNIAIAAREAKLARSKEIIWQKLGY